MTTAEKAYDVIVIGAGPVGEIFADATVRGGLSTVIVESELVGGDCSYWACMPSKALLRGSEALTAARSVRGAAAAITGEQDVAATLARRDSFASDWRDDGQVDWLRSRGIDLIRGTGALSGDKRVVVTAPDGTEQPLVARHAVGIATGTMSAMPRIEGLADARPWNSRDVTSAKKAPERLLIIGGGYVGCEMATAWQALGSSVTMLVRGDRLLPGLEPAAGEAVGDSMRKSGVDIRLCADIRSVRRDGDEVVLTTTDGEVRGDEVLVATGRSAQTENIGLDVVGMERSGFVDVDEDMRVRGVDGCWLYALGDINGRRLLTHMGKYQARQAGNAVVARARGEHVDLSDWSPHVATADRFAAPSVVFTHPQIAAVGMTSAHAADIALPHRVVEYPIGSVSGAKLFADEYTGTAIAVVDTQREVLLGVTFIGPGVAELLHAATIAIVGEVPIARLWHAVPAFPIISEIWLRLLETYRG